jgi:hypothetical protein
MGFLTDLSVEKQTSAPTPAPSLIVGEAVSWGMVTDGLRTDANQQDKAKSRSQFRSYCIGVPYFLNGALKMAPDATAGPQKV